MMKRMLWIFTGVFMLVSRFLIAGTYGGGNGTEAAPYQITTTADLIELRNNSGDWGAYFIQTADIAFNADETQVDWDGDRTANWDAEDQKGFLPIGNGTAFTGSYDGDGNTIDNLYINRPSTEYIALFGKTDAATIINIGVTHVDITGMDYVGGLVGYQDGGTVSYSYTTGSVDVTDSFVGGIIGNINVGTISNSYSTASVNGMLWVGGLIGHNTGTIKKCYAAGSVSGAMYIGGLVADVDNPENVVDSFWDTGTSGQSSSDGGTGKTTAQMKDVATFTDEITEGLTTAWDFETNPNDDATNNDYWDMDLSGTFNDGYPFLSWQNGEDTSLPVTLSTFTGKAVKGTVVLEWETSSEIENQGFVLSREERGTSSESVIASFATDDNLKGQGSTTETTKYTYADNTVEPGKTYVYTLADVDYAGTETILEKIEVQPREMSEAYFTGEAENAVVAEGYALDPVYPNPFN
ncbi:MAG: GLUG motif-containing protein, partial [Kosmotogaceae bacterium]